MQIGYFHKEKKEKKNKNLKINKVEVAIIDYEEITKDLKKNNSNFFLFLSKEKFITFGDDDPMNLLMDDLKIENLFEKAEGFSLQKLLFVNNKLFLRKIKERESNEEWQKMINYLRGEKREKRTKKLKSKRIFFFTLQTIGIEKF